MHPRDARELEGVEFAVGEPQGILQRGPVGRRGGLAMVVPPPAGRSQFGADPHIVEVVRTGHGGDEGMAVGQQRGRQCARVVAPGQVGDRCAVARQHRQRVSDRAMHVLECACQRHLGVAQPLDQRPMRDDRYAAIGAGLQDRAAAQLEHVLPQRTLFVGYREAQELLRADRVQGSGPQPGQQQRTRADRDAIGQLAPIEVKRSQHIRRHHRLAAGRVEEGETVDAIEAAAQRRHRVGELVRRGDRGLIGLGPAGGPAVSAPGERRRKRVRGLPAQAGRARPRSRDQQRARRADQGRIGPHLLPFDEMVTGSLETSFGILSDPEK